MTSLPLALLTLALFLPHGNAETHGSPVESLLPEAPEGYQWVKNDVLSDEFSGTSLDRSKWDPNHPYWTGREPSRFHEGNVSVADGLLHLRSTSMVNDLSEVADPQKDVWVHSACVTSKRRSAHLGYYECRFKASALSMTSSFWFQGGQCEIDVVEQIGAPKNHLSKAKEMLMNTHLFEHKEGKKVDHATPKKWTMPTGSADEFHTYGVWWKDENHAWFYHNGKKVAEITFPGPFAKPMYLFLDTEVFIWEGLPEIANLNNPDRNAMLVDWVRAWKLEPTTAVAQEANAKPLESPKP